MATDHRLKRAFGKMRERICFVGHTHDLLLVSYNGDKIERSHFPEDEIMLDDNHSYIVNVGSVGQPRDGTNTAKYVLWNTDTSKLTVRRLPYDIAKVVEKIRAAGLPKAHGWRLW